MRVSHGVVMIVILIGAYLIGVKFPSVGASVLTKVGLA